MMYIWTVILLGIAQPAAVSPPVAASARTSVPATRARAFLPGFFSTDDYPAAARRNGESGLVSISLAINRDGRVTNCTVTGSSGSAALDGATCSIIQRRARFTPARDERGRAVDDFTTARIRWELPVPPPLPVADQYQRLVFTFDEAGKVSSCRPEPAPAKPAPPRPCERLTELAALLAAERASSRVPAGSETVIETGTLVGGSGAARRLATARGEKRLHLDAVALDIDASGKIVRCAAADGVSRPAAAGATCARKPNPTFVPIATNAPARGVRQLVLYQVRYTRPAR